MSSVGAFLAGAITLLSSKMPGVNVSGPTELPLPEQADLSPTLIVDQVAGGNSSSWAVRECIYTLRCYGSTENDALTVWDLLEAALTDQVSGEPLSNVLVTWVDYRTTPPVSRKLWLYSTTLSVAGGPLPDTETQWPLLVGTATMRWSHKEI